MDDATRGTLAYVGDGGGVRGAEEWTLTVGADGSRTLRSSCWMLDTRIERHVVHTVSADFQPLRSFISQRRRGEFLGEGWFVFSDGRLEAQLLAPDGTPTQQHLDLARRPPYFVPHVVAADSWIVAAYDRDAGGRQPLPGGYATSLQPDGSTVPCAEELPDLTAELLAEESLSVPAGEYRTWHFVVRVHEGAEDHLWTTTDGTFTLVRLWSDRLASSYELVEHAVTAWPPMSVPRG